jgi:carboxymethylenebutenolidase
MPTDCRGGKSDPDGNDIDMSERVDLRTQDGVLDVYAFRPETGQGTWPAVIVYMDAFGIRPDLEVMARRLAASGYFVAVPNLYYRTGAFPAFDPRQVAVEGAERSRFKGMIASIDGTKVMQDTVAVIDWLDRTGSARTGRLAVVGYCMGGGYALRAAGTFPDRVAVAASFHGGSLATDTPDSPHLLAPRIRAKVYIGAAEIDPSFPGEQQKRLRQALAEAGVEHTLEIYEGAKHGFAVTGHLAYDRDASERHWQRLLTLLRVLGSDSGELSS